MSDTIRFKIALDSASASRETGSPFGSLVTEKADPILGREECAEILSDIIRASMADFITVDAKGAIRFKPIGPHTPHAGAIKRIKYDERRDRKGQLRRVITAIEMADTVKAIGLLCEIMGYCAAGNRETTEYRTAGIQADRPAAPSAAPLMPQADVIPAAVAA